MDAEPKDLVEQGLGLLASQYRNKPRFVALLTGILEAFQTVEDLYQAMVDLLDIDTRTGASLRIIARVLGMSDILPNGEAITDDEELRRLLRLRIFRISDACGTDNASILFVLTGIFDPTDTGLVLELQDLGGMYGWFTIFRSPTAHERGIMLLDRKLLPVASTVLLVKQYIPAAGAFCFSDVSDPGVPLVASGQGFNNLNSNPQTGLWSGVF